MASRARSDRDATAAKWPKVILPLTDEQRRINDDFMQHWLQVLPKYQLIEWFNHGYPIWHAPGDFTRTLEIGAGLGGHLRYERLTEDQRRNYYALELRENVARALTQAFPTIQAITGDCQEQLDFPDSFFDRILGIHVLEHLPNLPDAVREMHRLLNKETGVFSVVIPCEGGLAYSLARRISARRIFEKRYPGEVYDFYISREHINRPHEILEELDPYFTIEHRAFFPLVVPIVTMNLCIGLTLRPRPL